LSLRWRKSVLRAKNVCEIWKWFVVIDINSLNEGLHVFPLLSRHLALPFRSLECLNVFTLLDLRAPACSA
jgi:hypothetical protein